MPSFWGRSRGYPALSVESGAAAKEHRDAWRANYCSMVLPAAASAAALRWSLCTGALPARPVRCKHAGGDTAQTIARGVGFRFADVQTLFYAEQLAQAEARAAAAAATRGGGRGGGPPEAPGGGPAVTMPAMLQLEVSAWVLAWAHALALKRREGGWKGRAEGATGLGSPAQRGAARRVIDN